MTLSVTDITPNTGSMSGSGANQSVTITGKGFTGALAVQFGEVATTSFTVVSDTEITAAIPIFSTTGSINVQVNLPSGLSPMTSADMFTYTAASVTPVPILFSGNELSNTYIQFLGGTVVGTYYDGSGQLQTLQSNTAYSLMSIASGTPVAPNLPNDIPAVLVSSFSGRMYISVGRGLTGMGAVGSDYIPDAALPTDPNYTTRYQYIEPTIDNSQVYIDLTYIDFTSISLSMTAFNAPHATNEKQISQSSLRLATAAASAALLPNGSVLPSSADQLPSAAFARVISPQLATSALYHDFTHYLKTTLANKTVRIAGTYVGTGTQPSGTPSTQAQSYDFTATFDSHGNINLVPNADSGNGKAAGVPSVQQGQGVGDSRNISLTFSDLNANTGIFGCNAPYTLTAPSITTLGITNDFYGEVVGDLLAGLNFGFIGSSTSFNKITIGALASTQWWGGTMPDGTVVAISDTPGGEGMCFNRAQSNPLDYNSYAGSISALTTGYGFPLQDRLGTNLLTMNTATDLGSYLMVWVDITPVQ
jgi:hypothetical protein